MVTVIPSPSARGGVIHLRSRLHPAELFRATESPSNAPVTSPGWPLPPAARLTHDEVPPASAARVTRHVTGRDVCRAIAAIAPAYLGGRAEAFETLSGWGIRRGEDVGRVIAAQVDAGLLLASEEDTPASFEAAFEMERDLSSAGTS